MGRSLEAAAVYRELINRNADCLDYYQQLERCLGLNQRQLVPSSFFRSVFIARTIDHFAFSGPQRRSLREEAGAVRGNREAETARIRSQEDTPVFSQRSVLCFFR